jgi:hypothetical protein
LEARTEPTGECRVRLGCNLHPDQLDELKQLVRDQAAALADTETRLGAQAEAMDEMQERLNFAERMLTQFPNRPAVGPGQPGV